MAKAKSPAKARVSTKAKVTKKPRSTAVKSRTTTKSKAVSKKAAPAKKGLKHHAKRLYHVTPKFLHGMIAGALVGVMMVSILGTSVVVNPSKVSADSSCDRVNIIYCGLGGSSAAGYINSFQGYYNRNSSNGHNDLQVAYHWAGASDSDVKNMSTDNTKIGIVYRNGIVKVAGKVVAHDAAVSARFTEGRGFTKISSDIWVRKTSTSFARPSQKAIVHFKSNGQADFAVLTECGNSIKFTPTPPPAKPPTPTPPAPIQVCDLENYTIVTINQEDFDDTLYTKDTSHCVAPPTPTPTPTPTPVTPTPTALVNTGPGAVIIITALAVVGGIVFHKYHHHRQYKKHGHRA